MEKLSFGLAALLLYAQGRVAAFVAGTGIIDFVLAVFFLLRNGTQVPVPSRNHVALSESKSVAAVFGSGANSQDKDEHADEITTRMG